MYYFILNPVAGNGKLQSIHSKLKQILSTKNLLGEYIKTSGEGDAENLARIAIKKGYSTLISVGGDTTFNEVLNGSIGYDVTLGIIPIGVTNTVAKTLGISTDWKQAIDDISRRTIASYDVSKIVETRHYMFMSGGVGAETLLCNSKRGLNLMDIVSGKGYTNEFVDVLSNYRPCRMRFILDKSYSISCSVLSASVVNSSFFKKFYNSNLKFDNNDELLDLIILSAIPNKTLIPGIVEQFDLLDGRYLTRIRAKEIHIESFEEQQKVHVDGRVVSKTSCTFRVNPSKQRFIVG